MMMSKHLALDEVKAGMALAQEVRDAGGNCLLGQGAELSEATIASLRRRGVAHVMVAVEETLTPEQRAAREREVQDRMDYLFRNAGNDPMLFKLRAVVQQYRLAGLE